MPLVCAAPDAALFATLQVPAGVGMIEAVTRAGVGNMKAGKTVVVSATELDTPSCCTY
jgi:hypothetical protein